MFSQQKLKKVSPSARGDEVYKKIPCENRKYRYPYLRDNLRIGLVKLLVLNLDLFTS